MLHFDLSKVLPPRPYLYLSAFMPGLFLELSILFANPDLARQLALRSQEGFAPGRYVTLLVGLFLAFVIGNALMLFVWLIQRAIEWAYRNALSLWEKFETHALLPYLRKKMTESQRIPPKWVLALHARTAKNVRRVRDVEPSDDYLWWETFTKRLLLKRYGLSEGDLPPASFVPLQKVLTTPTAEELRGSILVNASHATGWAALIASYFAPALRANWYFAFALFLIAYGLLHAYDVANDLEDPDLGNLLRLRAVLREFPEVQPTGTIQPAPQNHADKRDGEA